MDSLEATFPVPGLLDRQAVLICGFKQGPTRPKLHGISIRMGPKVIGPYTLLDAFRLPDRSQGWVEGWRMIEGIALGLQKYYNVKPTDRRHPENNVSYMFDGGAVFDIFHGSPFEPLS